MNRRGFTQALAAAAFTAALARMQAETSATAAQAQPAAPAFGLSVMLWTVFNGLPFEERLAKVAEAGYRNVELVGEYSKWSDADFARANAARTALVNAGIPASQIRVISYGKEKPFCTESTESCWQQNRRAHFVYGQK